MNPKPFTPFTNPATTTQKIQMILRNRYIESLKAAIEQRKQARGDVITSALMRRARHIQKWYDSLPPSQRKPTWSMAELSLALRMPGNLIGPGLSSLGWKSRRNWGGRPFARFWTVPAYSAQDDRRPAP